MFNFSIAYNQGEHPLYNGNIAQTKWREANQDKSLRRYDYEYDALNRLTTATDNLNHYTLSELIYDKNGNIGKLYRRGNDASSPTSPNYNEIDKLTYQYDAGNKLLAVTDTAYSLFADEGFKDGNKSGNDYTYDANGNMTRDLNKGIKGATTSEKGITYNHLNLPVTVKINDGSAHNGTINYVYDATGVKLKKIISGTSNGITDYAGNYIYENGNLQFFNHTEGYVEPKNSDNLTQGFNYVFNYIDHLGNVRLSYTDANGDGDITTNEIVKESNYYPFGLEHKGYNNNVSPLGNSRAKKFKYNGIEQEEALGLDLYEMKFRQYNPAIGRFTSIDPVTHYSQSTYAAFDNNPIFWADPSGANSVYNWYTNRYEDEDGKEVSWESVQAEYGIGNNSGNTDNDTSGDANDLASLTGDNFALQSYPDKIDFVNTYSKEEKEKFLNSIIEWFGHIDKYGGDVHPGSIIDFYADLTPENEKYEEDFWTRISKSILGYEGHTSVHIKVGDNTVEIGYLNDVQTNADKYSATNVKFVGGVTFMEGKNTNAYKISIKNSGGFNNGADIIYMNFKGKNKQLYNQIMKRIKAYKPYKAKMIPHNKQ